MTVLVTGANGFVGSHLVDALLERGDAVTCLVRRTSDLRWLDARRIRLVYGDVTDASSLSTAVAGQDVVFHLAALLRANAYASYHRVNAEGTRNLAVAFSRHARNALRFVYLSSLAAAGPSSVARPRREDDPAEPISDYGRSKLEGERMLLETSDGVPYTIIRAPAVYGPREASILIYYRLIAKGLVLLPGDGSQAFDLIFIRDLVDAMVRAAESPDAASETFFVNDGSHHTWRTVAETIAQVMGRRAFEVRVPWRVLGPVSWVAERVAARRGNPAVLHRQKVLELRQAAWVCESTKASRILGFRPMFPLQRGTEEAVRWYRAEGWLRRR
jgi:nucleoside-diphosphate-sugar epimerase